MNAKWKSIGVVAMVMGLSIPVLENTAQAAENIAEEKAESTKQEDQSKEAEKKEEKALEWFKRIKFGGDLRYRNEMINEPGKEFEYRHRVRARIYIDVNLYTGLNALVGIGTGNSDDPVSTNQTLGDAFATKPLWLDLVYIDWHADYLKGWRLIGGKMKNVFYRVENTELLWDPDIRPEGVALTYKNRFGGLEPFFNSSTYWVEIRKNDRNSLVAGAQAGLKATILDGKLYFLAGAGYHDYIAIKGYAPYYDMEDGYGNTLDEIHENNDTPDDPDDDTISYVYANDYNLVNAFASIGGNVRKFPWAVFGDFVINPAATGDNIGWLVGASFGKLKKPLDFKFRYYYREVEADAVVGLFSDSDFNGGATNAQGHEANFGFQIVKYVQFALTYIYNRRPIENPKSTAYQRGQIDFNFKF